MPYPGAVKVHLDANGVRVFRDGNNFLLRDNCPVERVLEGDNLGRCTVIVRELCAWRGKDVQRTNGRPR